MIWSSGEWDAFIGREDSLHSQQEMGTEENVFQGLGSDGGRPFRHRNGRLPVG